MPSPPTPTLTLVQVCTANSDGTYTVVSTVTCPNSSMPPQVFCFTSGGSVFDHTATIFDLNTYPLVPDPILAYYRQAAVTQIFQLLTDAQEFVATIQSRVQSLVSLYGGTVNNFEGTFTNTYTG